MVARENTKKKEGFHEGESGYFEMNGKTIIVGSVTYAMKGKDILFAHGFKAYIERIKKTAGYGCGYAVTVRENGEEALKILRENGIKVLGVL